MLFPCALAQTTDDVHLPAGYGIWRDVKELLMTQSGRVEVDLTGDQSAAGRGAGHMEVDLTDDLPIAGGRSLGDLLLVQTFKVNGRAGAVGVFAGTDLGKSRLLRPTAAHAAQHLEFLVRHRGLSDKYRVLLLAGATKALGI
jgi:hypothetical protein